jgi:hypothetical protein
MSTLEELDALCVATDYLASEVGPFVTPDSYFGTLWQQLDCPAL